MQRSRSKYFERNGKSYLLVELDQKPNLDHIETVSGSRDQLYLDWELADTRKARPQQRRLFFALLSDIYTWSGMPTDFLKELFYLQYEEYMFGKQISLSDTTESSVSDANVLLDLVIDFMFTWRVPFKQGYELLPREQEYYQYQCCRHRRCMVCGREHSDINHVDTVGSGRDRNHLDHTQLRVNCLCREHHTEWHKIGPTAFGEKYHIPVAGIRLDEETLRKIGVRGIYGSDNNASQKV
ncbi:putative HNHc nuclease [Levilactobacillus brevis]|uniref:putative HNHc nuclease n=1 Tax=Levilactobacillus brevis TaxID=1580 RepID=UPI0020CC41EA|nr:putative HNHc nuclease [Levilactobacillus brevis]MCP9614757.1 putative HNHc nuclease [Levilactobacillus brevis]